MEHYPSNLVRKWIVPLVVKTRPTPALLLSILRSVKSKKQLARLAVTEGKNKDKSKQIAKHRKEDAILEQNPTSLEYQDRRFANVLFALSLLAIINLKLPNLISTIDESDISRRQIDPRERLLVALLSRLRRDIKNRWDWVGLNDSKIFWETFHIVCKIFIAFR